MLKFLSSLVDYTEVFIYLAIFVVIIVGISYVVNKFKPIWFSDILSIFNRPLFYVFLLLAAIVVGLYYTNMSDIKKIALMEYNREQLEQNVKDQQILMVQQRDVYDQQTQVTKLLIDQNDKLNARLESIDTYLNSDAAKKSDKPSSDVLKNTIRMLNSKPEKKQ